MSIQRYYENIPISGSGGYELVAEQTGPPYHEDVRQFAMNCSVDTPLSSTVLSSAAALDPQHLCR
jgi:hypothetical protein